MYVECGNILHKGSLNNLLEPNYPAGRGYPDIKKKAQSIRDLLWHHVIHVNEGTFLINERSLLFMCVLSDPANDHDVRTFVGVPDMSTATGPGGVPPDGTSPSWPAP
jgi:hypothetical protein